MDPSRFLGRGRNGRALDLSVLSTISSHIRSGMTLSAVEDSPVEAGAKAMAELAIIATTAAAKEFMVNFYKTEKLLQDRLQAFGRDCNKRKHEIASVILATGGPVHQFTRATILLVEVVGWQIFQLREEETNRDQNHIQLG